MMGVRPPDEKKVPKPLAKKSAKLGNSEKEYKKVRKAYLSKHIKCEVKNCNQVSTQIHHMAGRIGKFLTDSNHFLAVCSHHHGVIETDPFWAKERGYSISRLKTK